MSYYNESTDTFHFFPKDGCVEISKDEHELAINPPDGKRRKPNTYPFEFEDIPQPSTSELFASEFAELKKEYDADIQSLNMAFASAAMVYGVDQETKQASIRAQYDARKAEYNTAFAALRTKYYG